MIWRNTFKVLTAIRGGLFLAWKARKSKNSTDGNGFVFFFFLLFDMICFVRFAKFVNNEEFHVSEDELSSYERYNISNDLVDDDEEEEEFEASLTA